MEVKHTHGDVDGEASGELESEVAAATSGPMDAGLCEYQASRQVHCQAKKNTSILGPT